MLIACLRIEGSRTDEELDHSQEQYRLLMLSAHARRLRLIGILDLSTAGALDSKQRDVQAEWNHEVEQLLSAVCLGFVFVPPSKGMGDVMPAVYWIAPPRTPHVVFGTLERAVSWAFELCERNGAHLGESDQRECRDTFYNMSV